jgi:glucose-1-phosphate thymidylyltransferase
MKGIILAGGSGTRLHPITLAVSKQLLPVYDKPVIYYPLSVLMLAGIRDILLISTPHDLPSFQRLLKDGTRFGVRLSYAEQPSPDGLAQAFIIGSDFTGGDRVAMILGDNIFFGRGFAQLLRDLVASTDWGAAIFACHVRDPQRYGIVELDEDGGVLSLEEKPARPKSNLAMPGLYFYDGSVSRYASSLTPSARGELEIVDLNLIYHRQKKLKVCVLDDGIAWFDIGTAGSLLSAGNFVEAMQQRQNTQIACLEAIALDNGWISLDQVAKAAEPMGKSAYASYLWQLIGTQGGGWQGR